MKTEKFISSVNEERYMSLVRKFYGVFKSDYSKNVYTLIDDIFTIEEQQFIAKNIRNIKLTRALENCYIYGDTVTDLDIGLEAKTMYFDKNSNISNIDNTYSPYELNLILNGFSVKHVHRDFRGDWGDDGGHIVVVASKNEKWYVFVSFISYNVSVCGLEKSYKEFDEYNGAIEFVQNFISDVCVLSQTDDEETYLGENFEQLKELNLTVCNKENYKLINGFFYTFTSFYEDIFENTIAMKNIDKCDSYHGTSDFRLFANNRFDSYDDDAILKVK